MYNNFPQLFCTLLVFRSPAQRLILSLASSSHSKSSRVLLLPNQEQLSRLGYTSDSLPPSMFVPFDRSLYPGRNFCRPASSFVLRFSSKLVLTGVQPISKLINMSENICVRLIVSEATRICQEWVVVQDTHKVLVPKFWCFATAVQCFVQSPHLVFFQSCVVRLIWFCWFCKQILVDIRVQECCVYVNCNCDVV